MRRLGFALCLLAALSHDAAAAVRGASSSTGAYFVLPDARKNLDTGLVNIKDYEARPDAIRRFCAVTSTAGNPNVTIASPCSFTSADVGKYIVIQQEDATTPTSSLATTILSASGNSVTLATNAGQTRAAVTVGVSWGTDNAAAIQNAINQAAEQISATGQQGHVYVPTTVTSGTGTGNTTRGYGVASSLNIAPGNFPIRIEGAGRQASTIMALASMSSLVTGATTYKEGTDIQFITFDGNTVATDVGNFLFIPEAVLQGVKFSNPAPGGRALVVGGAGATGNIESLHSFSLMVTAEAPLYTDSAQYPDKLLDILMPDSIWTGLIAVGNVVTGQVDVSANAPNTTFFGPHAWGNTNTGTFAFRSQGLETWFFDPMIDAGNAQITGISLAAHMQSVIGGRVNTSGASNTGIAIAASKDSINVTGFQCRNFGTPANCIVQTYPTGNNYQVHGNPNSTITPAFIQALNQNPAGTTSTSGVMMGLGLSFTPLSSTLAYMQAKGNAANSTAGDGINIGVRYGTGAAPTNGAACTGSTAGTAQVLTSGTAGQKIGVNTDGYVASMTLGTTYWVDVCVLAITGGTATLTNLDLWARELRNY